MQYERTLGKIFTGSSNGIPVYLSGLPRLQCRSIDRRRKNGGCYDIIDKMANHRSRVSHTEACNMAYGMQNTHDTSCVSQRSEESFVCSPDKQAITKFREIIHI